MAAPGAPGSWHLQPRRASATAQGTDGRALSANAAPSQPRARRTEEAMQFNDDAAARFRAVVRDIGQGRDSGSHVRRLVLMAGGVVDPEGRVGRQAASVIMHDMMAKCAGVARARGVRPVPSDRVDALVAAYVAQPGHGGEFSEEQCRADAAALYDRALAILGRPAVGVADESKRLMGCHARDADCNLTRITKSAVPSPADGAR